MRIVISVMLMLLADSSAAGPSLKLPWRTGETWMVTTAYNGYCGAGCQDVYHTDGNNGYYALDFDCPGAVEGSGLAILAAAAGTVVESGGDPKKGFGYTVLIDHGDGYMTRYGHLKNWPMVRVGQAVAQGQQIGQLGSTGNSTADHLHFALLYNGLCRSNEVRSKPEPMSGYTSFTYGGRYISDNRLSVTPLYSTQHDGQWPYFAHLRRGQTAQWTVRYKNTGNQTWKGAGSTSNDPQHIELRACSATGTVGPSWLVTSSWISSSRVVTANEALIPPGSVATFTFTVRIPTMQSLGANQRAYFRPWHATGGLIMNPDGYYVQINLTPSHDLDGDGISDLWDRDAAGILRVDFARDNLDGWDWSGGGYGSSADPISDGDFDGDGLSDIAILRTPDRRWLIDLAKNGFGQWDMNLGGYGGAGDRIIAGDTDGDGISDIMVRDVAGAWHIDYAANGFGAWDWHGYGYGSVDDQIVSADYDGDGRDDLAMLRASDRRWCIDYAVNRFGGWDETYPGYGGRDDIPLAGDYDGDGRADITVLWTNDRTWRIDHSSGGYGAWAYILDGYGGISDRPLGGDYDGDGHDDIAVFRPADGGTCYDFWVYRDLTGWHGWDFCGSSSVLPAAEVMSRSVPMKQTIDRVTLQVDQLSAGQWDVNVYSVTGRRMISVVANTDPSWSTAGWPPGIYFYQCRGGVQHVRGRFVLLR